MTQRSIYIYCDGGLGNRFNALVGGLWLGQSLGLEPHVLWPQNNWCGAGFEDLFDSSVKICGWHYHTVFNMFPTVNVFHENQFHRDLNHLHPSYTSLEEIYSQLSLHPDHALFYFNSLIPPWMDQEQILKRILPQVPLKKQLTDLGDEIIAQHAGDQPFLGIHMRKTDFGSESASDQHYLDVVRGCAPQKVFVCSDDPVTESRFLQEPNVFVHDKSHYVEKLVQGDWNQVITDSNQMSWPFNVNRSSASVQEAVIDLWILSKSVIMDTNSRSTFLQMARLLEEARSVYTA